MTRNVALYAKDIVQNMEDAEEFMQGFSYEAFVSDKKRNLFLLSVFQ